jgi:sugar phosphate isomerase/epimerase
MTMLDRRDFLRRGTAALAVGALGPRFAAAGPPAFRNSLAQWSLHRALYGETPAGTDRVTLLRTDPDRALNGTLHPLDFPVIARRDYGIEGVEYVNTFMFGHADDAKYLDELDRRARGEGVTSVLIMCDLEGALGDPDAAARTQAVANHEKWLRAAARLGCHAIRVNAESRGAPEEQARLVADGLHALAVKAEPYRLHVIVENHGGLSSRAAWLVAAIRQAGHPLLGTLPDFGNFDVSASEHYDPYLGVTEMMPLAKAVSAKSHQFDAEGNESLVDFRRMMAIVRDAGYVNWVGIEYEGDGLSEPDGIRATKRLLERIREEEAR